MTLTFSRGFELDISFHSIYCRIGLHTLYAKRETGQPFTMFTTKPHQSELEAGTEFWGLGVYGNYARAC